MIFFFKISPNLIIAFPIFGLVPTKSFTSGPIYLNPQIAYHPKVFLNIILIKLTSDFEVKSEIFIFNFSHILISKSPSILRLPPSIKI